MYTKSFQNDHMNTGDATMLYLQKSGPADFKAAFLGICQVNGPHESVEVISKSSLYGDQLKVISVLSVLPLSRS